MTIISRKPIPPSPKGMCVTFSFKLEWPKKAAGSLPRDMSYSLQLHHLHWQRYRTPSGGPQSRSQEEPHRVRKHITCWQYAELTRDAHAYSLLSSCKAIFLLGEQDIFTLTKRPELEGTQATALQLPCIWSWLLIYWNKKYSSFSPEPTMLRFAIIWNHFII